MPSARLGLIVAKRHVPRAHARNRIKRVLRESFRLRRPELPAFDIVIQVAQKTDDIAPIREYAERLWADLIASAEE
jgi:ribonuclease P protein component